MASADIIELAEDEVFESMHETIMNNKIFRQNKLIENVQNFIFYVQDGEIVNYKKQTLSISDGKLTKKELLALVLSNNKIENKKYNLIGIQKYSSSIMPEQLRDFCLEKMESPLYESYSKVQDIHYGRTYNHFENYNYLFLVFSLNTTSKKQQTQSQIAAPVPPSPSTNSTNEQTQNTQSQNSQSPSQSNKQDNSILCKDSKVNNKTKTHKKVSFDIKPRNKTIKKHT